MTLYMPLFRSCTTHRSLLQIHAHLAATGRHRSPLAATILIESYAEAGDIRSARLVFNLFPCPDSFMWGVMIKCHVQNLSFTEAILLYRDMQQHPHLPHSSYTFPPILRACSALCNVPMARTVHGRITQCGLDSDASVQTSLLHMYAEAGCFDDACQVFDELPTRDVVSWGSMISSRVRCGRNDEALECFSIMNSENVKPDSVVMMQVARACAQLGALEHAKSVHGYIIRRAVKTDELVNSLIAMYEKCGHLISAEMIFRNASRRSVASWTAMISCYNQMSCYREALAVFEQMLEAEMEPNAVTLMGVLRSCALLGCLREGRSVHGYIVRTGTDPCFSSVGTALLNFYGSFRRLADCFAVFECIDTKALISWNSLLAACRQNGFSEIALRLFLRMHRSGLIPDSFTFSCLLPACGHAGDFSLGIQIHSLTTKSGFYFNIFVQNSLIDMYCKCGSAETAKRVFSEIEAKDVVTWNAMISGLSQSGDSETAIQLFDQMHCEEHEMDVVTILTAIQACSDLGALGKGRLMHQKLVISGLKDTYTDTALINMYARCGDIEMARRVFNSISEKNVVSWSSIISCYKSHGLADEAIALFSQMILSGITPNEVTFLSILSACSHAGLVEEGMFYFELMAQEFHIEPQLDHCACVVDLLSRAGHIDTASNLIKSMTVEPNATIWRSLLNGCNIHHMKDMVCEIQREFQSNKMDPGKLLMPPV